MLSDVYREDFNKMLDALDFLRCVNSIKQRFSSEMLVSAFTALPRSFKEIVTGAYLK